MSDFELEINIPSKLAYEIKITIPKEIASLINEQALKDEVNDELYQQLEKRTKCGFCGDYFIPRKHGSRFCPPEVPGERSKCANRYDAMVRRARNWHFKDGLSPEEIQKKIKKPNRRNSEEVKGWLVKREEK